MLGTWSCAVVGQGNKYKAQSGALVRLPQFRGLGEPSVWLCIDKLGTQTQVMLVSHQSTSTHVSWLMT